MSNKLTSHQKGEAISLPIQNEANDSQASNNSEQVITVNAVEIPQKLTVQEIFEKFEQGRAMQEIYSRHVARQKDLIEFEAEASDDSGFVLRTTLKGGRSIEFSHLPSNLDFVREQIRKNKANIEMMEQKIKDFRIS